MKRGDIFFLSSGDYSDYHVNGHFRVLADFDMDEVKQSFHRAQPKTKMVERRYGYNEKREFVAFSTPRMVKEKHTPSQEEFVSFLIQLELIEPVNEIREFHNSDLGLAY